MNDKEIFFRLNKYLKLVENDYSYENIFGIYVDNIIDNQIIATVVIIPPFNTICTTTEPIGGSYISEEYIIKLFDIRNTYNATRLGYPDVVKALDTEYLIVNPLYEHIFNKQYKANKELIKEGIRTGKPAEELKLALMKLCRMVWNDTSGTVSFIKQLSDAEKLALEGIVKIIGDEGTFSQAKAASAIGVSRLSMTTLIEKMKRNEVAIVQHMGPHGTYVKIIDDTLLHIRK